LNKRQAGKHWILNKARSQILNEGWVSENELGIIYKEDLGHGFRTELKGIKKKGFTGGE